MLLYQAQICRSSKYLLNWFRLYERSLSGRYEARRGWSEGTYACFLQGFQVSALSGAWVLFNRRVMQSMTQSCAELSFSASLCNFLRVPPRTSAQLCGYLRVPLRLPLRNSAVKQTWFAVYKNHLLHNVPVRKKCFGHTRGVKIGLLTQSAGGDFL